MSTRIPAYAVIVAGGSGARMGTALPKQFLPLCGKPVLYYSIRAFMDAIPGVHIILVLPAQQLSLANGVLQAFSEPIDATIVAGGDTRYASVAAGLALVPPDSVVLVHDGARPLVSPALIERCYAAACAHGSAIPIVPVTDSIRRVSAAGSAAVSRDDLRSVQTPQAFRTELLQAAFRQPWQPHFTDEASVVEAAGHAVELVDGERSNLKITTPEDLVIAAAFLGGDAEGEPFADA